MNQATVLTQYPDLVSDESAFNMVEILQALRFTCDTVVPVVPVFNALGQVSRVRPEHPLQADRLAGDLTLAS